MRTEKFKLSIDELEHSLSDLVKVMTGDSDINWFKRHWELLDRTGLTSYSNDVEKHLVYIYALTLSILRREYLCKLYDEGCEITISYLVESLNLSQFRIGQLVGKDFEVDLYTKDEEESNGLFELALIELVNENKTKLVRLFQSHYRNDLTFYESFANDVRIDTASDVTVKTRLANEAEVDNENGDDFEADFSDSEGDEFEGGSEEAAFGWVTEGCPSILNY